MESIHGNLVDIENRDIQAVRLTFAEGIITAIDPLSEANRCDTFLLPGFVDAHVHVESSMLSPAQFARTAVTHGTIATVSDPHEIANVLGVAGVEFMLKDALRFPFKFWFGAPSCVPATSFETSGATIDVAQTEALLDHPQIHYLAEMMNFPGVLQGDQDVLSKIQAALQRNLPVDGHAPGLRGQQARDYFRSGITTDHECFTEAEAVDKLGDGVFIQIREGSAARNFEALQPLIDRYPGQIMFCSDDKHPDELLVGHINQLCQRAIRAGSDLFHVLRAACLTPVQHYGIPTGQLRVGDPADLIEVDSLSEFNVLRTFIDGQCVAQGGQATLDVDPAEPINHFCCSPKSPEDFVITSEDRPQQIRVIDAQDGALTTDCGYAKPKMTNDQVVSDPERDLLKITVVNRYQDAPPAIAFVRSFGLKRGAIASSVAHDSHNIIAIGVTENELCRAVNSVIDCQGGLSVVDGEQTQTLPLPLAGLMSTQSCEQVASEYQQIDQMAKALGCKMAAPFMTLSFLALLVIPSLKLSDLGLFDAERFQFVGLRA